ncbi:MAG: flagellar type III secretion system protein FliR [Helicobacteraceae bacterium]|jgi:flagellar biosynthetic protein FliR|nr:flagellar type III secretion system protein FliR [Helicobacteraceae bacterium]
MTDFAFFFTDDRVVSFILLFIRVGAIFVFFPFFSAATIYPAVKGAIAFLLAVAFYPILPPLGFAINGANVMTAIFSELLFGFAAGFVLHLVFGAVQYAGEQISFAMSFSMAATMDPQTESNSTMITQFLYMIAILLFLALDGHHLVLLFFAKSLTAAPLGLALFTADFARYAIKGFAWLFTLGVMIAFPITALSLLSDIIFGMIMKTVPSFNLLVVGLPARILLAFLVLTATMASFAFVFQKEFQRAYNALAPLFFQ